MSLELPIPRIEHPDEDDGTGSVIFDGEAGSDVDQGEMTAPSSVNQSFQEESPVKTETNDAPLAEDPFESKASRILFDAIDRLQSCNIKKEINSPQLVIVGAQSAGKSSLLQSLTGIPFPVGKGCCTRFATRIVSRRTDPGSPNEVHISIVPPDFSVDGFDYAPNDVYKEYSRTRQTITLADFAEIVEEVSTKYLGIKPGRSKGHKNFAAEVLKIEVSGPNRSYFSILDIPGFISNSFKVRGPEMDGVRKLIAGYMSQPDNIVICVADAGVDLETQGIFEMARDNVEASRLIGVYTKCDRTDNKESVVGVVNGTDRDQGVHAGHGWFVVRNKTDSDEEDPNFDLEEAEKELFSAYPWTAISSNRKGSAMLKRYLAGLLSEKIRVAFPQILKQLNTLTRQKRKQKERLGTPRDTSAERRAFLVAVAQKYQLDAREALERPWLLDQIASRARIIIRESNDAFSRKMRHSGHTYMFENHYLTLEQYISNIHKIVFPKPASTSEDPAQPKTEAQLEADCYFEDEGYGDDAEIEESDQLLKRIEREVKVCSSTGLPGMVHPEVIQRLFQYQTFKWHSIARDHLLVVAHAVKIASESILEAVCPSMGSTTALHTELLNVLNKFQDESLLVAERELEKYCTSTCSKLLQTTDPGFINKLQMLRTLRVATSLQIATTVCDSGRTTNASEEMVLHKLFEECHHSSLGNTVNDVHDTLKVYYEYSLQGFIRHTTSTIIEDYVTDLNGPLKRLSPDYIYRLTDADVDELGSENREVVEERDILRTQIRDLEIAEQTARTAMDEARLAA